MQTARGMIGMPVVCGGKRIGRTVQADIAGDLSRMEGIWLSAGFRGTRYIPADSVEMLGETAVIVDYAGVRKNLRQQPLFRRAVSTDGQRLGAITNAEIDGLSFAVTALELSCGVWDDLAHRRQRVELFTVNPQNGEVIVDPAGQEKEGEFDEERIDEGTDRGDADRRFGRDGIRRDELADGAQLEPQDEADGQLDLRPGG